MDQWWSPRNDTNLGLDSVTSVRSCYLYMSRGHHHDSDALCPMDSWNSEQVRSPFDQRAGQNDAG